MTMRNSDYWKQRFIQLESAQNQTGEEACKNIESQYREAQNQLDAKITMWYQRFADNNGITLGEAKQYMQKADLKEFKWTVDEYIKYGKENDGTGRWMKELENASARFHVSKYEALKIHIRQAIEELYAKQSKTVDKTMKSIYKSGYYHTAYEVQKGFGIGWDIAGINPNKLEKVIGKPWAVDGVNFSDRIWKNKDKLISELHNEITKNLMLGENPKNAIDAISKKMKTSRYNAGRLVMTESAYFSSQAQKDCFNDLDVEKYQIVATLDSHTSEICRDLDGKVFEMKDFEPGTTAPPFHVWCRTTTVPYFDDDFGDVGERAARDEKTGKTYYVPGNLTYRQWENAFVKDGDKSGFEKVEDNGIIRYTPREENKKTKAEELKVENFPDAFKSKSEIKNTQAFVDYINGLEGANPDVIALFNRMGKLENLESNGIPFKISHGKNHSVTPSYYEPSGDLAEVKLTIPKLQGDNLAGQVNTILHEEMHLMDLYGRKEPEKLGPLFSSNRPSLVNAFKNTSDSIGDDVAKLFKDYSVEYTKVYKETSAKYTKMVEELEESYYKGTYNGTYEDYEKECKRLEREGKKEIDYVMRNAMGGGIGELQDIYDALSGGLFWDNEIVVFGHGEEYYSDLSARAEETLANYVALSVTRPDLVEMLRTDKPNLVAELEVTIAELLKKAGD